MLPWLRIFCTLWGMETMILISLKEEPTWRWTAGLFWWEGKTLKRSGFWSCSATCHASDIPCGGTVFGWWPLETHLLSLLPWGVPPTSSLSKCDTLRSGLRWYVGSPLKMLLLNISCLARKKLRLDTDYWVATGESPLRMRGLLGLSIPSEALSGIQSQERPLSIPQAAQEGPCEAINPQNPKRQYIVDTSCHRVWEWSVWESLAACCVCSLPTSSSKSAGIGWTRVKTRCVHSVRYCRSFPVS